MRWAVLTYALSMAGFFAIWQLAATYIFIPLFLPSPVATATAAWDLARHGELGADMVASSLRILGGFSAGGLVGVLLGLATGGLPAVRRVIEPQLQFFRFIPPIAILPIALLWLGAGEESKLFVVFYGTSFIVILGTAAAVSAVPRTTLRAAGSLGAGRRQLFLHVIVPASIPGILTSLVVALGMSFMTIVSAEMVAARSGLGFLVYSARLRYQTDWIFVGIAALGLLGFLADRIFRTLGNRITRRYGTKL